MKNSEYDQEIQQSHTADMKSFFHQNTQIFMKVNQIILSHLVLEVSTLGLGKYKNFTPNIPAWCMNKPKILFDLHSGKKFETSPIIMNLVLMNLILIILIKHIFILTVQRMI